MHADLTQPCRPACCARVLCPRAVGPRVMPACCRPTCCASVLCPRAVPACCARVLCTRAVHPPCSCRPTCCAAGPLHLGSRAQQRPWPYLRACEKSDGWLAAWGLCYTEKAPNAWQRRATQKTRSPTINPIGPTEKPHRPSTKHYRKDSPGDAWGLCGCVLIRPSTVWPLPFTAL